jgi:hypothetical protein
MNLVTIDTGTLPDGIKRGVVIFGPALPRIIPSRTAGRAAISESYLYDSGRTPGTIIAVDVVPSVDP